MQAVSNEFKELAKSNARISLAKFIIKDSNTEIDGETIIDGFIEEPTCDDTSLVGNVMAKNLETSIYNNFTNDFIGKEIYAYTGQQLEGGTEEYVPRGTFIIDEIEEDVSSGALKLKGLDYTIKFNKAWEDPLDWENNTYTLGDFAKAVCEFCDLELETEEFSNSDYVLTQQPAFEGYQCRYVMQRIAEIATSNVFISPEDKVQIRLAPQNYVSAEGSSITLEESANSRLKIDEFDGEITQETTILPSGYTQVEYIQSDETNVINTGVLPSENIDIEIDIDDITTTNQFGSPLGYRNANTNQFWWYIDPSQNQRIFARWGTNNYSSNFYYTTGERVKVRQNKNGLFVNGTLVTSAFSSATITGSYNIYIFACNNNNASQWQTNSKLYRAKIWNNGALIRDFIPCYRNSDNKIGVYDLVNNVFYTKQGTNEFTKGSNVTLPTPEYPQNVEITTGRQSVDLAGKNLLPQDKYIATQTKNGITYTNNGDGTFNISGTASANTIFQIITYDVFDLEANQPYYLYSSVPYNATTFNMSIPMTDNGATKYLLANSTYTPTSKPTLVRLQFYVASGNSVNVTNVRMMLVKGSIAPTTYEPYKGKEHEINLGKNLYPYEGMTNQYTLIMPCYIGEKFTLSFKGSATSSQKVFLRTYGGNNAPTSTMIDNEIIYVNTTPTNYSKTLTSTINGYLYVVTSVAPTNYTFENIQIERGSVATSFSPYFEPIFLGKINNYKDFIRLGNGKNLFNVNATPLFLQRVSISINNNSITQTNSGNYARSEWAINGFEIGQEYTFHFDFTNPNRSGIRINIYDSTNTSQIAQNTFSSQTSGNMSLTFNATETTQIIRIYTNTSSTSNTYSVVLKDIQLEKGNTQTEFEPYGFKDKWYLYKAINKVILNGSENWSINGTDRYKVEIESVNGDWSIPCYCNNFKNIVDWDTHAITNYSVCIRNGTWGVNKARYSFVDRDFTTVTAWKSYLASDNVVLYYPLEGHISTPTTTEITNDNYPELLSQLKAIEKARSLDGITYIDVDSANLPFKLSLQYDKKDVEDIDINSIMSLEVEDTSYKPYNAVTLALADGIEGENVTLRDESSIALYGERALVITANEFAINQAVREELIEEMFNSINGFNYVPMKLEYNSYDWLERYDRIKVQYDDDNYYETYLFNHTTEFPATIKSVIEDVAISENKVKYEFVPETQQKNVHTEIVVDKLNGTISEVVSTQEEFQDSLSQLSVTVDGIQSKVELNYDFVRETSGNNYVSVDDIQQEGLLELKITGTAISSGNLILHITNNVPEYIELPISTILKQGNVADELSIEAIYNEETELYELHCFIDKKLDYIENQIVTRSSTNNFLLNQDSTKLTTESGEDLLLDDYVEGKQDLGIISIPIQEGQHVFSIENFNNLSYYLKYAVLNNITSEFALKKHIISEINQTPESISISADKVSLEGKTINLTSDTINIESDNFKVDNDGNMTCNNATMNNATINGTIEKTTTNGTIKIGKDDGELIELVANTFNYVSKTKIANAGIFTYLDDKPRARLYDTELALFSASGDRTINAEGQDGYIRCVALVQTSSEKSKKNFEKLKNALDIVKNTDIFKYNFALEKDDDKKHIGFVIGDNFKYRKEITSKENDGVEIYSMVGVLWQAVKEQQEQIEELEKQIDILKGGK